MPGDGVAGIRTHCEQAIAAGRSFVERRLARRCYALSDLAYDLRAAVPSPIGGGILVEAWRRSADLVLAVNGRWTEGGNGWCASLSRST